MIIIISIILNIINYQYFTTFLSFIWYLTSLLIIYLAIILTKKYKLIQFNLKEIIRSLKSHSNNNISPIGSLCISLAAKIGVGSLSGVALAIYYGGIGSIFWMIIISAFIAINTYEECIFGIKYRTKINHEYVGGPSYYINKVLHNKYLSILYGILIIICYSGLFLSIQSNTIITITNYYSINNYLIIIILFITTLIILITGTKGISKVNSILVPLMLTIYLILGIYIFISNIHNIPSIMINVLKDALNIRSIIPVFLIGMQRAIFITESSLGASAISASSCDNFPHYQGLLEVLGIYITIFIVSLTTFIIIITSNYQGITFNNFNGIELLGYAFEYHFGSIGRIILSIITILFAFSTIISSYFFGERNLTVISQKKSIKNIFKIFFMSILIISCFLKANTIWNLTDLFVAILVIINVTSLLKIEKITN